MNISSSRFLGLIKSKIKYTKSTIFKDIGPYFQKIRDDLSFELTNAQKKLLLRFTQI